jgi:hypothetical protein
MNPQNVDAIVVPEKCEPETMNVRGGYGMPTEGPNEEVGLDELVDYKPVPPRRVVRITTRYQRQGRGRPLPYLLDEAGCE